MFCAPKLIFGCTEGSHFNVLRNRTHCRQYRGRRVQFNVLRCRPVFGGTEGIGSRFHVLRSRTRFRRYRGRCVLFSCFALQDSFSAVTGASGTIFMFCAPVLIFGCTKGVVSRIHILRSRAHYRRDRGRRAPFSYFALPHPFSAVPRALGLVFMFCAPRLIFGGNDYVGSSLHV
jgi:hypothetical protein